MHEETISVPFVPYHPFTSFQNVQLLGEVWMMTSEASMNGAMRLILDFNSRIIRLEPRPYRIYCMHSMEGDSIRIVLAWIKNTSESALNLIRDIISSLDFGTKLCTDKILRDSLIDIARRNLIRHIESIARASCQ